MLARARGGSAAFGQEAMSPRHLGHKRGTQALVEGPHGPILGLAITMFEVGERERGVNLAGGQGAVRINALDQGGR